MVVDLALSFPDSEAFHHLYCRGPGAKVGWGTVEPLTTPLAIEGSALTIVAIMFVAAFLSLLIILLKMTFIVPYN